MRLTNIVQLGIKELWGLIRDPMMLALIIMPVVVLYTGDKNDLTAHGYFQGAGVLLNYPISQGDANGIPTATVNISKGAGTLVWTTGAPTT